MTTRGYLGIDAGTQGLSVLLTDEAMNVLATGDGDYQMIAGLEDGHYEQHPDDWIAALVSAMADLRNRLPEAHQEFEVLGIGISGQMHGEVLADADGVVVGAARLWCDGRNESEGNELTELFGVKIPKRMTIARWLWTLRNHPQKAESVRHLTTPAGWISYRLTGKWTLGIGDAAGMFPIDAGTLDYSVNRLDAFDALTGPDALAIRQLLPDVRRAGQDGGTLHAQGAELLGLPEGTLLAPAEGDQPASLAGSLIGQAGMVSVSFGTSVCANSVGDRAFTGVRRIIDHFCAPDGKPINMVFLRNGTTFMNTIVEMFAQVLEAKDDGFAALMPEVLRANPDCDGLLAIPFMDDEPGLGIEQGGTATLIGLSAENARPGNAVKAALLATMFNLRMGTRVLDDQEFPRTELILSGGLTRTPELAQILADVMNTPVVLLESSTEGCAWGAAIMAKFRYAHARSNSGSAPAWAPFLAQHASAAQTRYQPNPQAVAAYDQVYTRYCQLIDAHPAIAASTGNSAGPAIS